MSKFKQWMDAATTKEQNDLARRARTTRAYLYHLSSGQRDASADMAGRIERATTVMNDKNKKLPIISRTDLCAACKSCPYARQCQGK